MRGAKLRKKIAYISILLILVLIPVFDKNPHHLGIFVFVLLDVLLATSLWIILQTGQVTLGHGAFAAIGGYVSAALVTSFGLNFWLSLPTALAVAGIIAIGTGYLTLRIKGMYFMMVTLALVEILRIIFGMLDYPFGGLTGIVSIPPPDRFRIGGIVIDFASRSSFYYLSLVLVIFGIVVTYRLDVSPLGRVFRGISQADNLAEHIGIDIMQYKVLAFVIGSIFAALAGTLYAFNTGCILPSSFTLIQSTYYLIFVTVGGHGSIAGPILGATVFSILSEVLRPIKEFEPIVYSCLLIIVMLFFRTGLLGIWQTLLQRTESFIRSLRVQVSTRNGTTPHL